MKANNQRLLKTILILESILLIPLIGKQVSDEINWSLFDFVSMGILLLGLGIMIELVLRIAQKKYLRILLISVVIILFLLIWAELAVGLFGTPFAGS